jgi:hypothetical protein
MRTFMVALLFISAGTTVVSADIITNGNFEQGNLQGWSTHEALSGTSGNGEADVVTSGRCGDSHALLHPTDGNNFALIRATAHDEGGMSATFYNYSISQAFVATANAILSFDYAGPSLATSPPGYYAYVSSIVLDSQAISASVSYDHWTNLTSPVSPGSHTLTLTVGTWAKVPYGSDGYVENSDYMAIDNVRLVPVPEPQGLLGLFTGAIGFLAYARRRRRI